MTAVFLYISKKLFAARMYLKAAAADAREVGAFAYAALVKLRRLFLELAQLSLPRPPVVAHAVHQRKAGREVGGGHSGAGAAFFALFDKMAVVLHVGGAVALFLKLVYGG